MDEAAVGRALKQIDPRFVLQKHPRGGVEGGWVYKVVFFASDTYAPVVFTWMDEYGTPLPLSSGLVETFKRLALDSRNREPDADEFNRRLAEQRAKERRDISEAIIADHTPRIARGRVGVSLATAKKPRYWRTRTARPKSGKSA